MQTKNTGRDERLFTSFTTKSLLRLTAAILTYYLFGFVGSIKCETTETSQKQDVAVSNRGYSVRYEIRSHLMGRSKGKTLHTRGYFIVLSVYDTDR